MRAWSGWIVADKLSVLFMSALLAFTLSSKRSFAQEEEDAPAPPAATPKSAPAKSSGGSKKKTAVTFEESLIEGEVKRPEFFYFLQKKQFNFGRLIKLRENFLPEMRKTSEAIQRRGGGSD